MNKTTKLIGSASGMLALAAFSGLVAGTANTAKAASRSITSPTAQIAAGAKVQRLQAAATHACKGQNACKGQGGCKTGDQGCKGKNSCKGNGGCSTAPATAPAPGIL
ncbi:MAG: hypothetical protein ABSH22_11030 [Tepidisphaeraceae bacterium]|jgi:hypothetical protein